MLIREYQQPDRDALRAIHAAQGFEYAFPDLRNPLFVTKLVLSDGVAPGFSLADVLGQTERDASKNSGAHDAASATASQGKIVGAALLRLTAEAYLILDPKIGTPRERWQWLLALHAATERDAWARGLDDVHAWLPPPIAKTFGRRLERLGWLRDDVWTPYCKRLAARK